jgi:hypothetical protein
MHIHFAKIPEVDLKSKQSQGKQYFPAEGLDSRDDFYCQHSGTSLIQELKEKSSTDPCKHGPSQPDDPCEPDFSRDIDQLLDEE